MKWVIGIVVGLLVIGFVLLVAFVFVKGFVQENGRACFRCCCCCKSCARSEADSV